MKSWASKDPYKYQKLLYSCERSLKWIKKIKKIVQKLACVLRYFIPGQLFSNRGGGGVLKKKGIMIVGCWWCFTVKYNGRFWRALLLCPLLIYGSIGDRRGCMDSNIYRQGGKSMGLDISMQPSATYQMGNACILVYYPTMSY